ncbi:MAG: AAA family ATPase, partial [Xanthomarina sp.]
PYNYRIIFLSLSIFNSSLAIESPPINIKPLDEPDASEIIHNFINNKQQETAEPISGQPSFGDLEIKEMEFVFIRSPKEAQCIVNHLQNPSYFPLNQHYRSVIFVGDPGTGKTVMAKAIAHKMTKHDWEYKFLPSTSFLGEHRNQTAILLQKELGAIKKSKKPTILIIDELNLLMENSESKNHDTDATAKALWTFLDQQKDNTDFFFIGTMNRTNKLPKAFKSRIILNCIKFPLVSNPEFKNDFIRKILTTETTKLDTEVTNEFLNQELKKMGDCSERDLKNILLTMCRTSKMNAPADPSPMVIKKAFITAAIDQYVKNKIELDYDFEEETDEQRQNRHHKENMHMHESHFAQQQLIQIILSYENNPLISIRDFIHKREGYATSLLTDEQLKFCESIITNIQAKRTQEATRKS